MAAGAAKDPGMKLFKCSHCGALVFFRREAGGGPLLLCEYDRLFIVPGPDGADCGLDISGALVRGRFAGRGAAGAAEVVPCHLPRCRGRREARLPYKDD
jgi:hypothetical protein